MVINQIKILKSMKKNHLLVLIGKVGEYQGLKGNFCPFYSSCSIVCDICYLSDEQLQVWVWLYFVCVLLMFDYNMKVDQIENIFGI